MSTPTTGSVPATTIRTGGGVLPKTGGDLWIPLAAGGGAIGIALAARRATRRTTI